MTLMLTLENGYKPILSINADAAPDSWCEWTLKVHAHQAISSAVAARNRFGTHFPASTPAIACVHNTIVNPLSVLLTKPWTGGWNAVERPFQLPAPFTAIEEYYQPNHGTARNRQSGRCLNGAVYPFLASTLTPRLALCVNRPQEEGNKRITR